MSHSQSPTDNVYDDPDGYELQIAIDQLAAGSSEALRVYLAHKTGLDPATVSLSTSPFEIRSDPAVTFSYAGKLDNTQAPGVEQMHEPNAELHRPDVAFDDTEIPFEYEPLDPKLKQIRLLRLGAADEEGVIRDLQVENFCLADAPPYFCLSYVWGNPERLLAVNCNGKMVSVTQNLYHALRTCLNRHPTTWFWADGICINQDNIVERSQQVLLMGSIYKGAKLVLAHPGHYQYERRKDEDEDSTKETTLEDRMGGLGVQDMMSFCTEDLVQDEHSAESKKLYGLSDFTLEPVDDAYGSEGVQGAISIMTFMTRIWEDQRRDTVMSDREWDKVGLPETETEEGREIWNKLIRFWVTDWYFRTWVLQEVILAPKVVVLYGEAAISLEAITDFWDLARRHGLPRPLRIGMYAEVFSMIIHLSPVSSFKVLRGRRQGFGTSQTVGDAEKVEEETAQRGPPLNLLELLCLTRNNLATDARDKVYGLLGLTDDPVAQSIIPNYSSNNTPEKVFTEVARIMIEAGHVVDLLHHAGIDQGITNLPSWVPDWTVQSRSTLSTQLYHCMPNTSSKISVSSSGEAPRMTIRGMILDRLNFVGPSWKYYIHNKTDDTFNSFESAPDLEIPAFNDEDSRNFILTFATVTVQDDFKERYTDEGLDDALVRTLAMDRSWRGERIGPRKKGEEVENEVSSLLATNKNGDDSKSPAPTTISKEFFAGVDAFRRFYAQGPNEENEEDAPGIRVHQTAIFKWLLDFDVDVEADLQKRMVPFTIPFQEAQRGRRFATIGTRGHKKEEDIAQDATILGEKRDRPLYNTKSLDHHYIGTVPWNAQVEDYVVLLEGFRTPFVLRKLPNSTGSCVRDEFQIIGDCYVHGIMDGELLKPIDGLADNLEVEQVGVNAEGKEYAVENFEGYLHFQDFVIV
ncbi:heterokaryon incompatibility protein-domain-containing protein [Colletotrichum godetiae]|uniref:Heterokaryon incompatibility protein-domain-containing protein n=1 Tax=Colletotrichum godetiae TaxID=1209918 RepID=A0AAJ0ACA5_9PEZI|nr:heterokaryon incompatibility protein-domain-containing protein [Colletotrichum godetiae]KAK1671239.1 heterokaryon incompatibility protein-domain-containing protein [Colletotrichum godetiae]